MSKLDVVKSLNGYQFDGNEFILSEDANWVYLNIGDLNIYSIEKENHFQKMIDNLDLKNRSELFLDQVRQMFIDNFYLKSEQKEEFVSMLIEKAQSILKTERVA